MKIKFSLIMSLFVTSASYAQSSDEKTVNYGMKAGAIYSSISGLETTILSEANFKNYTLKMKPRYGWSAGMFLNYRLEHKVLGLQTEITYAQQGSDLLFDNFEKDFNYKMQFDYQFLNIAGLLKVYPWGGSEQNGLNGLNVGVGPQLGLNVAPQNIIYTSWGPGKRPEFGPDLLQQQQLRNVLKGKTNFGFTVGLGYEFKNFGLTLDTRYQMAITDAVETQSNSYNFIENKNTNQTFQFSVGWDFSFFR
jgi:hypothetical protein